jgi:hypothetical protein
MQVTRIHLVDKSVVKRCHNCGRFRYVEFFTRYIGPDRIEKEQDLCNLCSKNPEMIVACKLMTKISSIAMIRVLL